MTVKIAPKYLLETTLRPEGLVVKKLRVAREQAAESIRRLYRTTPRYSAHHTFIPCLNLDTQGVRSEVLDWHLVRNNLVKADRWDRLCGLGMGSPRSLTVITSKCVAASGLKHDVTERLEQELNLLAHGSSHQAEPHTELHVFTSDRLSNNHGSLPSESTSKICKATSFLTVADCEVLQAIDDMLCESMPVKYASILSSNSFASRYLSKYNVHIAGHVDKG